MIAEDSREGLGFSQAARGLEGKALAAEVRSSVNLGTVPTLKVKREKKKHLASLCVSVTLW